MTKNIEQYRWRRESENREIVEYVLFSSSVIYIVTYVIYIGQYIGPMMWAKTYWTSTN
jgi:hypothetical protein